MRKTERARAIKREKLHVDIILNEKNLEEEVAA